MQHYNTAAVPEKGYSSVLSGQPSIQPTESRRSGPAMRLDAITGGDNFERSIPDSPDTEGAVIGAAIKISGTFFTDSVFFGIAGDDGNYVVNVSLGTDGSFSIGRGGLMDVGTKGTTLATSDPGDFTPNVYKYYELKYIPHLTTGTVELRINEQVIITFTGDTITSFETGRGVAGNSNTSFINVNLHDLYALSTESGTDNNDYLGDVRVDCFFADTDGAENTFTPAIGTVNADMVDDLTPDGDTTYVQAGTIGDVELYNVDALSLGTQIYGVQQVSSTRKTDAGAVEMSFSTKNSGGTRIEAGDESIGDSYGFIVDMMDNDPESGNDWTDAIVNSTQFGFRIKQIT